MKSAFGEIVETIILAAVIFFLVRSAVQTFRVEGRSMEPTLYTGQRLLVNKAAYWSFDASVVLRYLPGQSVGTNEPNRISPFGAPKRGDVIVFRYPLDPNRDFIKRVIGEPGDTVAIKEGTVYLNGQAIHEPYVKTVPRYDLAEQTVPPNQYFVLGDNRNSSSDSHVWGMVPRENIIGQALLCYWPPQQWGFLASTAPLAAQDVELGEEDQE